MHLTQLANVQYQYYYLFYIKNKYVKTNCEIKCHQYTQGRMQDFSGDFGYSLHQSCSGAGTHRNGVPT